MAASALVLFAAPIASASDEDPDLDALLSFEVPGSSAEPLPGWRGGPQETLHADSTTVHGGHIAARLERTAASSMTFSTITAHLPLGVKGEWLELRGFLRTENVVGYAGLWLREDGAGGSVQFDNMGDQGLDGTTDWTEYSVKLPLDERGRDLYFGVLVSGEGTVWADDLQLLVDGVPFDEAPERPKVLTVLDTDQEFLAGSGITVSSLTDDQVDDLALLGKVWGFLKYHHPRVAAGKVHWDFELFRVLPDVLAAADRAAARRALADWAERLGVPDSCEPCAHEAENVHLLPRLDWIRDEAYLGPRLSRQLPAIYTNRFAGDDPFYVSRTAGVRNPVFDRELGYAELQTPDTGYRFLALFRYWNIIEYWYPNRDLIDEDWDAVLRDVLPRLAAASDRDTYRLEMLALIARVHDTHANLWSAIDVRPPRGECWWPASVRFVEGRATVVALPDDADLAATPLEIGDVIDAIDGQSVASLVKEWSSLYAASNPARRRHDIARFLLRGACGPVALTVERDDVRRPLRLTRAGKQAPKPYAHDRPGPAFQLLSPDVAYLKLSEVHAEDVPGYLEKAVGTRGWVIDIRNYPSEFVVFALGSHLVEEPTPFVRFTTGDLANPGAFTWTDPLELSPASPTYEGQVAILVDASSISQSEYTAMAFRADPRAVVVGSTTAGADGNVSSIPLPGGLKTNISGIGVFYPDKTPTQRVGIVADIPAAPTIAGIRARRDEILEAALRHLVGPEANEETIRAMARRPES